VVEAFEAQRQFLVITTKAKKPDLSSQVYLDTLKDIQEEMTKVDEIREKNRASPQKDHLAMVADGVGALAWVTIDLKPAEYVAELFGGAQMYGNKVLKEQKDGYVYLKKGPQVLKALHPSRSRSLTSLQGCSAGRMGQIIL
jgi:adenylyl cyclase-associated protein